MLERFHLRVYGATDFKKMAMNFKKILNPVTREITAAFNDIFTKSLPQYSLPTSCLGVDIGTHAVKIARVEKFKDGLKVLGFAVEKIVDKAVREALSKALAKVMVPLDQPAAIAVSGQGVVSRYVEFPMMNRTELESSMRFEIEKYVPFPLADVVSDYAVVYEMKNKAKMSILIAAAKNDLIQKKLNLAKEKGLRVKVMDLDCLALANFVNFLSDDGQKKGESLAIINIGSVNSNINILVDGQPHLSRDIFIGGDDITKKISESLEIAYDDAEQLKLNPQGYQGGAEGLMALWEPILSNLVSEVRVSLDYLESRTNKAIEKIYITGGSSRLAGIEEYFNHYLGIETKKLDFVGRLSYGPTLDQDEFRKNSDLLAVALGLALR
jgi:type IV pilus assembly protein PilM